MTVSVSLSEPVLLLAAGVTIPWNTVQCSQCGLSLVVLFPAPYSCRNIQHPPSPARINRMINPGPETRSQPFFFLFFSSASPLFYYMYTGNSSCISQFCCLIFLWWYLFCKLPEAGSVQLTDPFLQVSSSIKSSTELEYVCYARKWTATLLETISCLATAFLQK